MARLPEGKQRLGIGYFYEMKPSKEKLGINVTVTVRWYAWPPLMWRYVRENLDVKWYEYPEIIGIIVKQTLSKLIKGVNA